MPFMLAKPEAQSRVLALCCSDVKGQRECAAKWKVILLFLPLMQFALFCAERERNIVMKRLIRLKYLSRDLCCE